MGIKSRFDKNLRIILFTVNAVMVKSVMAINLFCG